MLKRLGILLGVLLLTTTVHAQDTITFTITNEDPISVCFVYFSPSSSGDWGDERLGLFDTLQTGETKSWDIPPDIYDIYLADCDVNTLYEEFGIDLTTNTILTYPLDTQTIPAEAALNAAQDATLDQIAALTIEGIDDIIEERFEEAEVVYEQLVPLVESMDGLSTERLEFERYATDVIGLGVLGWKVRRDTELADQRRVEGRNAEAIRHYQAALQAFDNFELFSNNPDAHESLNTLNIVRDGIPTAVGQIHVRQGQYAQALDMYNRALDNLTPPDETPDAFRAGVYSLTLASIGEIYALQNRYEEALQVYQRMLDLQTSDDNVTEAIVASTHLYMAEVYAQLGEDDKALEAFETVLGTTSLETILNADPPPRTIGLGRVLFNQQRYDEARRLFETEIAIQQAQGDQQEIGRATINLGRVFAATNDFTGAIERFNTALNIAQSVNDPIGQITALTERAATYETVGNVNAAIADYTAATTRISTVLENAALNSSVAAMARQTQNTQPFDRLVTLQLAQGDPRTAYDTAERARAILARTEITSDSINFRETLDAELIQQEQELRYAVTDAQGALDVLREDATATADAIQQAETELQNARRAYAQHLETMQLRGGYLARELVFESAPLDEVQAALPPNTTLLLYTITDTDSSAFIVTPSGLDAVTLNVNAAQIENAVRNFSADRRTNTAALSSLYDMVYAPLADRITTSRVMIAPDGVLNYVPFAALQAPDGSYLIDRHAVSVISSGTVLTLLHDRETSAPTTPALVLAQPDAPGLPRLGSARAEAIDVSGVFGVTPEISATETTLRQSVSGTGVLHISAHAELDRFAPLFSAVHLGSDDLHDGRLEVREIYELDLTATQLVVLSGCETGVGGDGEDFGLLNRAFMAAGVPRVVSSLWAVDDEATALLLSTYMQERQNTDNEADALRAAMLTTRQTHPDPYLWASFVLTGLP